MAQNEDNKVIYSMMRVSKTRGTKQILKNISLSYFYGAKIGVIGSNGSGKSTLMRILAGVDTNFDGETAVSPGFTLGYLEQDPLLESDKTVREVVEEGVAETVALMKEYDEINDKFGEPMDDDAMEKLLARQGEVMEKLEQKNAWDLDSRLDMAMDALRCPPGDAKVAVLSGGERRRVALCRLLLQQPDILLLDEPTNHLDAETVAWLEHHLKNYAGTIIAVTHDRYFLDNVAGWILELDRGEGIPWKGNYSSWLEQKQERLRVEEKKESDRQKTLERELQWIRMTPKARQTKSKARINNYDDLANSSAAIGPGEMAIPIPKGPRLGSTVLTIENGSKTLGDKNLFTDLNFELPAGAIVGIIGPNGAGKSTMFKVITGSEALDEGTIALGETVKIAHVDQMRSALDESKTVWEQISEGNDLLTINGQSYNSRAYVSKFNFAGADQQKRIADLSGGEKNRVNLALTLLSAGNLLLLDEPTNDLDVNTLRALEEGIDNFAGSVLVISHDRWFLDRICTHILAFEGESSVRLFYGNYSEYEEVRKKELGVSELVPTRIKYRSLTRD